VRITRKGQITVPKRLRERFGITPEVDVEFLEEKGRLVLVKAAPETAVRAIRGKVKRLPFGKDVDEYLRATRGPR
jgi:AbrB family looped-hinge helix DNA binding protein